MGMTKRNHTPIGIDIGRVHMRAAQRAADGSWRTACVRRKSTDDVPTSSEVAYLGEVLWRRGFVGRAIHLKVPDAITREAAAETPPPESGAPVQDIAAAELARFYDLDPTSITTTLIPLRDRARQGSGFRAHAVAVPKRALADLVARFHDLKRGGLTIDAVAAGPAPMLDLALRVWPAEPLIVAIEPGDTCLRLTIAESHATEGAALLVARRLDDLGYSAMRDAERPLTPAALLGRIAEEFNSLMVFLTRLRPDLGRIPTLVTAGGEQAERIGLALRSRPELAALMTQLDPANSSLALDGAMLSAAAAALGAAHMADAEPATARGAA